MSNFSVLGLLNLGISPRFSLFVSPLTSVLGHGPRVWPRTLEWAGNSSGLPVGDVWATCQKEFDRCSPGRVGLCNVPHQ